MVVFVVGYSVSTYFIQYDLSLLWIPCGQEALLGLLTDLIVPWGQI